ncbi:uncharacterized protein [Antedon mediterranea]|uniref:uncharacterized protein n=1 Tax=Antedon mediterranea TaxID=105859 RepID=UPI003AF8174C
MLKLFEETIMVAKKKFTSLKRKSQDIGEVDDDLFRCILYEYNIKHNLKQESLQDIHFYSGQDIGEVLKMLKLFEETIMVAKKKFTSLKRKSNIFDIGEVSTIFKLFEMKNDLINFSEMLYIIKKLNTSKTGKGNINTVKTATEKNHIVIIIYLYIDGVRIIIILKFFFNVY